CAAGHGGGRSPGAARGRSDRSAAGARCTSRASREHSMSRVPRITNMGERTSYQPGTFSWSELVTSDAAAAKRFYTSLFGWEYDDMPIPDGPAYSMAKRDGKTVAALYQSDEQPP